MNSQTLENGTQIFLENKQLKAIMSRSEYLAYKNNTEVLANSTFTSSLLVNLEDEDASLVYNLNQFELGLVDQKSILNSTNDKSEYASMVKNLFIAVLQPLLYYEEKKMFDTSFNPLNFIIERKGKNEFNNAKFFYRSNKFPASIDNVSLADQSAKLLMYLLVPETDLEHNVSYENIDPQFLFSKIDTVEFAETYGQNIIDLVFEVIDEKKSVYEMLKSLDPTMSSIEFVEEAPSLNLELTNMVVDEENEIVGEEASDVFFAQKQEDDEDLENDLLANSADIDKGEKKSSSPTQKKKKSKKRLYILLILLLIVGSAGGAYYYKTQQDKKAEMETIQKNAENSKEVEENFNIYEDAKKEFKNKDLEKSLSYADKVDASLLGEEAKKNLFLIYLENKEYEKALDTWDTNEAGEAVLVKVQENHDEDKLKELETSNNVINFQQAVLNKKYDDVISYSQTINTSSLDRQKTIMYAYMNRGDINEYLNEAVSFAQEQDDSKKSLDILKKIAYQRILDQGGDKKSDLKKEVDKAME